MPDYLTRDRLAVLAALAAPLGLAAILVPFRTSFPNTDAALALVLVVVAVAANGYRLAGILAAVSTAVWFDFFLTQPYPALAGTAAAGDRVRRPGGCRAGHEPPRRPELTGASPGRQPQLGGARTASAARLPGH
jgi:hypothetical protein